LKSLAVRKRSIADSPLFPQRRFRFEVRIMIFLNLRITIYWHLN
jgi:hypothetical protein